MCRQKTCFFQSTTPKQYNQQNQYNSSVCNAVAKSNLPLHSTESNSILVLFCRTIWCSVTESATITVLVLKVATVIFQAGFLFTLKLYSTSLFFWSWFWSVLRFLLSTFFTDFLFLVSVINTLCFWHCKVQTKLSFWHFKL